MDKKTSKAIYANDFANAAKLKANWNNQVQNGLSPAANSAKGPTSLPSAPTEGDVLYQLSTIGVAMTSDKFAQGTANESVFSNYATYVDNWFPKSAATMPPMHTARIKSIQVKLATAQNTHETNLKKAVAGWKSANETFLGKFLNFSEFLSGTSWGDKINADNNAVSDQTTALNSLMTTVYGPEYIAIQNAKAIVDGVRSSLNGSSTSS